MNIPEIKQIERAGHIEEALNEYKTLLIAFPGDRETRTAMSWCLKLIASEASKKKDTERFVQVFEDLASLNLAEIDMVSMANRFSWEIKTLFDALKNEPTRLVDVANRLNVILPCLSFKRPDKYYTLLADAFLKVKGPQGAVWDGFADFMDWFGFDNLRDEDYERIPLKQAGQSLVSIAERVHSSYFKVLRNRIKNNLASTEAVERFIDRLTALNNTHPEYQYTLYHKSLLLMALGRKREALDSVRPFVWRKQSEFWVWDVLCDCVDDDETKLSCCCRALMSKTEPGFLVRVQLKASQLMHNLGYDGNAKYELQSMQKAYADNGWRVPSEAIELSREEWFVSAEAPESNKRFYELYLEKSEDLLYSGVPEVAVLATYVNREKRVFRFATSDRQQGVSSTKKIRQHISVNRIYLVRIDGNIDEKNTKILTCREATDISPYADVLFKKIDGVLHLREGNEYGFVGNIYVDKGLLPDGVSNGTRVSGTAILSFNRKKASWGWKALIIKI